jgi:hypothetical protein
MSGAANAAAGPSAPAPPYVRVPQNNDDVDMNDVPGRTELHETLRVSLPDKYHGKREELETFLMQVELYFRFNDEKFTTDDSYTMWVSSYLRGSAMKWMEPFLKDYLNNEDHPELQMQTTVEMFDDFSGFKREIRKVFGDIDEAKTAMRKLDGLKQAKSAIEYATEFRTYGISTGWDTKALIYNFVKGLKSDVQSELARSDLGNDLNLVIQRAVKIDNRLYELRKDQKKWSGGQQIKLRDSREAGAATKTTGYPKKSNFSSKQPAKKTTEKLCFNCDKPGHFARDCTQERRAKPQKKGTKAPYWKKKEGGAAYREIALADRNEEDNDWMNWVNDNDRFTDPEDYEEESLREEPEQEDSPRDDLPAQAEIWRLGHQKDRHYVWTPEEVEKPPFMELETSDHCGLVGCRFRVVRRNKDSVELSCLEIEDERRVCRIGALDPRPQLREEWFYMGWKDECRQWEILGDIKPAFKDYTMADYHYNNSPQPTEGSTYEVIYRDEKRIVFLRDSTDERIVIPIKEEKEDSAMARLEPYLRVGDVWEIAGQGRDTRIWERLIPNPPRESPYREDEIFPAPAGTVELVRHTPYRYGGVDPSGRYWKNQLTGDEVFEPRNRGWPTNPGPSREIAATGKLQQLTMKVTMGNIEMEIMIDSGAMGSFIDEKFVRYHGIPTETIDRPYKLQLLDGEKAGEEDGWVKRRTRVMKIVTESGHMEYFSFDLLPLGRHAAILGTNWINRHNPSIDWQKGTIEFNRCHCWTE